MEADAKPYRKPLVHTKNSIGEASTLTLRPVIKLQGHCVDFKAGQHFFEEGQRMSNFNSLFLQPRYHRWLKRIVAEPGSTHAAGSSVAATTELGRACSDAL